MTDLYAIVDLGTNTFHVLIAAKAGNNETNILLTKKIPVKIGEGGINQGYISPQAFERGLEACKAFETLIRDYGANHVKVLGTSAIRNASNSSEFVDSIEAIFNTSIQIIDGDKEAELIYYGVRWAIGMWNNPSLIMDIGGGSVEFIIANQHQIYWKASFEVGAARLIEKFPHHFPIQEEEQQAIEHYLDKYLGPLFDEIQHYQIKSIIGASGSFETYTSIELQTFLGTNADPLPTMHRFGKANFEQIRSMIFNSNKEDLEQMPGMQSFRVDMINAATTLIDLILTKTGIDHIYYSGYAVKEGILWELVNENKDP